MSFAIAYGLIFVHDAVVKVSTQEAILAKFLYARSPKMVPLDEVIAEMWRPSREPANPRNCLLTLSSRLARALHGTALSIETLGSGVGYKTTDLQARILNKTEIESLRVERAAKRPRKKRVDEVPFESADAR